MNVSRWEPFRDLFSGNDLFHPAFGGRVSGPAGDDNQGVRTWAPSVDIYENPESLTMKVDLPGVDPNQVELRVEGNTLYLKGERKLDEGMKGGNYHRVERTYGAFSRSFTLPNSLDLGKISAQYKDGILTLTLPKRQEAQPKTVKIQVQAA